MSSKVPDHVPRVGRKDAVPGRDVRPVLGPSDAVLSAPLHYTDESYQVPDSVLNDYRPQITGAADAVTGAPLTPPPDGAREGLQLGVDAAGGFAVPKELDGDKRRRRP
jgi:hypothetical protein